MFDDDDDDDDDEDEDDDDDDDDDGSKGLKQGSIGRSSALYNRKYAKT